MLNIFVIANSSSFLFNNTPLGYIVASGIRRFNGMQGLIYD